MNKTKIMKQIIGLQDRKEYLSKEKSRIELSLKQTEKDIGLLKSELKKK